MKLTVIMDKIMNSGSNRQGRMILTIIINSEILKKRFFNWKTLTILDPNLIIDRLWYTIVLSIII